MKHIVKRAGHFEPYDARKLYGSIYAAMLSVRESVGAAELVAAAVVKATEKWLEPKHEVTANDLRRVAGKQLRRLNDNAGFQYLHHRVIG